MRALLIISLALAAGCGPRVPSTPEFPGAPVVLISVDTLRADHLPVYGYSKVQTSSIDALQRDSILFENAYSHCPLTLPSHLSMLTGLLPADHGVRSNLGYRFDGAAHPTLARRLRARGYATGAAVSAYVLRGATGISESFDFFDDAVGGDAEWTRDLSTLQRPGLETARRALAWVEGVKSRPFFLFLHIYEPHFPYEPPEPFRSRYGATYDGEVAASDGVVGEFLGQLRRDGIYDRAIVLLVSDHGEGLGDHGEQEHGILLYREVLHVPLLLKLPGSRDAGKRVRDPVGLIDVVPTIIALLKLGASEPLEGVSLLDRDRRGRAQGIYSETYYPRIHFGWSDLRSLVNARHHYIDGPKAELYEIVQDPRETVDTFVADATVARSMKKELDGHVTGLADPGRVDPGVAEKLKALGYLSQATPTREGDVLPNPRDRIHVHEALKAARQLGLQGKDEEALSTLRRLPEKDRGSFEAQRELAGTLARLHRYEAAAAAYEEAMRLSPRLAGSLAIPLGLVELEMGRLDEATGHAQAALAEDPGHAHLLLAKVALARRDLGEAERQARLAMADAAADSEGAMVLAQVHVRRSELPPALTVLDQARARAIEQRRAPATGLDSLRADVLGRLGRFPEAEAVLKEEIRSSPGRSQAYASLAVMVALQGRPRSEVHEILDSMVKANPARETILLGAKTLVFLGDKDAARAWRRRLK
ncbi:MAG TPA: sulfatase-like hydrolase/transferase [Vicinamibacteria bacterium]